jgi:hypothetical protein
MPRGNDSEAALSDLADRFGQGVGNAEVLIAAAQAMRPQRLRRAEMLPRDDKLTAEAREKHVGTKHGPHGSLVIDAAVRRSAGQEPITVIVYRDDSGREHLGVLDEYDKVIEPDFTAAAHVQERSPKPPKTRD